jgi:hypothetical protein
MNPLEKIKEKLKQKPIVKSAEPVEVIIPVASKKQDIKIHSITFIDERKKNKDFDITELSQQLESRKLNKVVTKDTVKLSEQPVAPPTEKNAPATKKVKKIAKAALTIVEEDDEDEDDLDTLLPREEEFAVVEKKETVKKGRKTKRPEKGISVLSPEDWVDIDKASIIERLPPKKAHVNYKVSSYYMNNREIFVNFINSLFQPYRDENLDDTKEITCESISSQGSNVSLLSHQKLVRDYMNLYTPYRGLLVYHSLGSGKTCTAIALSEGMKSSRKIIVMTPASLRRNYIEEIKKCGDPIYKTNQYWEWISTKKHPELLETLSSILNLSVEYIEKKGGAWLVDVRKPSNYSDLSADNGKSLNEQIDEMIQSKYKFINYNGLRRDKLKDMTDNFEKNIFDNAVIVIDEAHNLISRIVNKLSKEKEVPTDKHGNKERLPFSLALVLYELLMNAQNARVILLTGTPIINYPNEIGILFNILRGYIKTWEIPLDVKGGQKVDKEMLSEIFKREKVLDYMDYNLASKKLTITRNPFGFENKEKKESGYHGVTNKKKEYTDKSTGKTVVEDRGTISDDDFERKVIRILSDNKIEVLKSNITVHLYKALPDKFEDFANRFIDGTSGNVKNIELFKKRIMGLTSYFRSAQEKLLPRYEKASDYKIIKIPMSDYQFNIYEEARQQERKVESKSKQKKGSVDENGIFKEPSSTYRIFSRLYCNFVMPRPPGRPLPNEDKEPGALGEKEEEEEQEKEEDKEKEKDKKGKPSKKENEDNNLTNLYDRVLKEGEKKGTNDLEGEWDGNLEGDEVIEKIADSTYDKRIQSAIGYLKEHAAEYLSPSGLETYSPKYLHMLENIQDKEHIGLHLVYSQFRTLEGIGIFKMVLEQNGFTQFRIKKNNSGNWELDIDEEDRGKPTFALYTGTESAEEKEVIRNIYNSNWENIAVSSPALYEELKNTANNNNVGEIIKVLMITASGSEGINLRNTRYVHIMEPYWHPARLEQVIGRARRICSHKDLPEKLQTVEVFLYLMTFTQEQIKSDKSIELKLKDLSKKTYKLRPDKPDEAKIPFTSDETLFEISTIKEEVSNQIITAIKEASIDCATYSKRGSKEQLHCLQFGQVAPSRFSYNPYIGSDETDKVANINKKVIEWRGKEITIKGKKYVYRKIDDRVKNVYDYESYKLALEKPGIEPVLVGTLETNQRGEPVFKQI